MQETDAAIILKMGIHYASDHLSDEIREDCLNIAASFIWQAKDDEQFELYCKWWKEGISEYNRSYEKETQLYLDLQNKVFEFSKYTFDRKFSQIVFV